MLNEIENLSKYAIDKQSLIDFIGGNTI